MSFFGLPWKQLKTVPQTIKAPITSPIHHCRNGNDAPQKMPKKTRRCERHRNQIHNGFRERLVAGIKPNVVEREKSNRVVT
jgi:hypothetical protein